MKILVIAEKPDMGRSIAAAIEPKAKNNRTHLEGERYIITWAIGHLIGLAEPDHYDEKYKRWNFVHLPIIPERFKLLPHIRTKDQLKVIKELAARCERLVNACDAGREGQLIFSFIQEHLRLTHPVQRLWISDLTPETIRTGFAQLKAAAEYENLTLAARARSEADWLIGMNGSRAFTTKHGELLSVGRVQTPVLALIYDRQKEIEAFDSQKFYEVEAFFRQDRAAGSIAPGTAEGVPPAAEAAGDLAETNAATLYRGVWQGERITDKARAEAIAAKVQGQPGAIVSYEVKETKEYPFKLYDLTLLQREANAKFGFSAKKTLDTAQALYEKHKVISYPRTNSNYVTEQNIPDMHAALDALRGTSYDSFGRGAQRNLVHKMNKAICNPAKVEDHHAILPTKKKAGALNPDEQKIYDLIIRRFLAHFYPAAEYKVHTLLTEVCEERFKTVVKELLAPGWKVLYPQERKSEPAARKGKSSAKQGAEAEPGGADSEREDEAEETATPFAPDPDHPVECREAHAKEKETQPPKPFTEGTLLKAMEGAGKQIEDEELREAMKDSGLGTPATRAATIERLKQVGYIGMRGRRIDITQKGRAAIELIRGAGIAVLTSPEMTGRWERRLTEIARGQAQAGAFMESVKTFTRLIVDKVRVQPKAARLSFGSSAEIGGGDGGKSDAKKSRTRKTKGEPPAEGEKGAAPTTRTRKAAGAKQGETEASAMTAAATEGGQASAARVAKAAATGSAAAAAAPPAVRTAETIAACPRPGCGGRLFMGRKGYGCSHYKEGCRFVIWKESFGKILSAAMIRTLLETGRTGKLTFTAETGETFTARFVLKDKNTGGLELERE